MNAAPDQSPFPNQSGAPDLAAAPNPAGPRAQSSQPHDLWVFGYGSLMWRPGFAPAETVRARLTGLQRRFCVYSFHHRGTHARPGLVLGLDSGGVCDGVAYRVDPDSASDVLAYLREREQVSGVYREALRPLSLSDGSGRQVKALTYIVERAHPQYAGALQLGVQARVIRGASGLSGVNLDYLMNTLTHLRELGIRERQLERLGAMIGPHITDPARTMAMTNNWCRQPVKLRPISKSYNARFIHRRSFVAWS